MMVAGVQEGASMSRRLLLLLLVVIESASHDMRRFPGHRVEGPISLQLETETMVQCLAACLASGGGDCPAFNLLGTAPSFSCVILAGFRDLVEDSQSSVYYNIALYENFEFVNALGRRVYLPDPGASSVSWVTAYWDCKDLWAAFLVPMDTAEWQWMKERAENRSFAGTWIGIQESLENSNTYHWMGIKAILAPGNVNITWSEDGVDTYMQNIITGLFFLEDDYDCALLQLPSQEVIIEDCYAYHPGFMCEPVFPSP